MRRQRFYFRIRIRKGSKKVAAAVEMRGITKKFGDFTANDNINFQVEWAQIHGICGENGAGKTTLMNTLYGLHQPTSGTI